MAADGTVRVGRLASVLVPPMPPGLLRCHPLGDPPAMRFFALARGAEIVVGNYRP